MSFKQSVILAYEEIEAFVLDSIDEGQLWLARLNEFERLTLIGLFILFLLVLIVLKSGRRRSEPSNGRSFVTSLVLVMLFSFGAGWILDSRFHFASFF